MMLAFKNFIEKYTTLPNNEWIIIQDRFERKVFAKDDIILEQGKVCKYFYFLEEGLIRYLTLNDGEDITKFFTVAPYCFTSPISFRNQTPANESIQSLDELVTWRITLQQSNELLEIKSWNTFTRKFVHEVQGHMEQML